MSSNTSIYSLNRKTGTIQDLYNLAEITEKWQIKHKSEIIFVKSTTIVEKDHNEKSTTQRITQRKKVEN